MTQRPPHTARFFSLLTLATMLLTMPGCGFHPVYGGRDANGTPVADELADVAIEPMADHPGQMLRNDLIDRFYSNGRPAAPRYHLIVSLHVIDEDLGTLANGTTTLAAVLATGDYKLTDGSGVALISGTTSSTAQYDKLSSMYGTLAAHDSAVERTVREVSEQLTARLGLYFAERQNTPAKP